MEPQNMGLFDLQGSAGTGKTATCMEIARRCQDANMLTAILTPTGVLADSFRKLSVHATIDTMHGFVACSGGDPQELRAKVLQHSLIIIDEIWLLSLELIEPLLEAWLASGRWPVVVTCGDPQQLRPWNEDGSPVRTWGSSFFYRESSKHSLKHPWRQDMTDFKFLHAVRYSFPTIGWFEQLQKQCLCYNSVVVNALLIERVLREVPDTIFLALSKAQVCELNDLVAGHRYRGLRPLGALSSEVTAL